MIEKRYFLILVSLIIAVLISGFVIADFSLGEFELETIGNESVGETVSYEIEDEYGPGGTISGKINLSLDDEPHDSEIVGSFDGSEEDSISLIDFLDNNDADYDCSISSCDVGYAASGDGSSNRAISVTSSGVLLGMKVVGDEIDSIDGFSMDLISNVGDNFNLPLKIDLLGDGELEWAAYDVVDPVEFGGADYGCYDSGADSVGVTDTISYCNKITLSPSPSVYIGADLIDSSESLDFRMSISNVLKKVEDVLFQLNF
jgi:hypothetical protein